MTVISKKGKLYLTKAKDENDSIKVHDSVFESLWRKAKEGTSDCEQLEVLCEELDHLYNNNPKDPQFKKYIKEANTYATNLSKISADILKNLRAFSNLG